MIGHAQSELFDSTKGDDLLGAAFCEEHDAASRRAHGITLTPPWLVAAMLAALQGERFDTVIDAGAGTGRFSIAAAAQWPQARVLALESHPRMAALLRQRVRELNLADRIEVIEQDFRDCAAPAAGRTLYLGNPPYVRHHDIDARWKGWYAGGMAALGIRASQLAGLHAHFVLAAAQRMRPGDMLCFVTSAEWLDNGYGAALRSLLAGGLGPTLRGLWIADAREPVFSDALVTSSVFLAQSGPAAPVVAGGIDRAGLRQVRTLPLEAFTGVARWSELCRDQALIASQGVEVGELFNVVRGQVTGANNVFVRPAHDSDLPRELTRAAVTRAREIIDGQVLTEAGVVGLKRVVDLPADLDALQPSARRAALAFIDRARTLGADQGYVARSRKPWYAVAMRSPPAAFVSYMGRRPPVFVANPWGVSYLNIAHGLYPRAPLSTDALQSILHHLNTTTSLFSGRVYGGGLAKFEPSDVARLCVPGHVLEAAA